MYIPTAIIAMGGNSISPKGETGTIHQQFSHIRETVEGISHFSERGYNLCINHGNGPQVGNELLRMDPNTRPGPFVTSRSMCGWNTGDHRIYDSAVVAE